MTDVKDNIPEGCSDLVKRDLAPKVEDKIIKIMRCPCGENPENLRVETSGKASKVGQVRATCCGHWSVDFINNNDDPKKTLIMAIAAWNAAPRAS